MAAAAAAAVVAALQLKPCVVGKTGIRLWRARMLAVGGTPRVAEVAIPSRQHVWPSQALGRRSQLPPTFGKIPTTEMLRRAVPPPPPPPAVTVGDGSRSAFVLWDTSGCVHNKSSWLSSDRYEAASSAQPSLTPSHPIAFPG